MAVIKMGKHKKDKLNKAVRDNPISRPGGLGDQLDKDLVLDPDNQKRRGKDNTGEEVDPEVSRFGERGSKKELNLELAKLFDLCSDYGCIVFSSIWIPRQQRGF